jgi:endonuclease I
VSFGFAPSAFFVTDAHLDYTLVAVDPGGQPERLRPYGFNRLIAEEGKVLVGEALNIVQHPSGERKQLALRENQLVDLLEDFLHYESDTAPGSSGAPVFNDEWELVALHHSGVPRRDAAGRLLALDGSLWQPAMGEAQIAWVANEGARISRIARHLRAQPLTGAHAALRDELFAAVPPPPGPPELAPATAPVATLTVPLHITVSVGAPAPTAVAPAMPVDAPAVTFCAVEPADDDPELRAALDELQRGRERVYYSEVRDRAERERYYAGIDPDGAAPDGLYATLHDLVSRTHREALRYAPARQLYPWVDLHPDRKLRSIYSGKTFDAEELIRADLAAERGLREAMARLRLDEAMEPAEAARAFEQLEAAFPFNCEHVVPQSWFARREPMRGDLHHLFACEWGCNSFRGNTPYEELADVEEAIRPECGRREGDGFEPAHGKGAVARAALYFLLRYPGELSPSELEPGRIEVLLGWHAGDAVGRYERHRNQAIFAAQGNRNPLIDHPEWASAVGFGAALAHVTP